MGADLLVTVLWTDGKPLDEGKAVEAVRQVLFKETDLEVLNAAAEFLGLSPLEDLAGAVIFADEVAKAAYFEKLLAEYRKTIKVFVDGLSSRQVSTITFGGCLGYVTGGMSWGDAPTDKFDEWQEILFNDGETGLLWNPYRNEIYRSLFIAPDKRWAMAGDTTVDEIIFAVK